MAHLSNPSPAPPLKRSRRPAAPPSSAWYAARAILDETDTHYLIRWEGSDPGTSAPFEPSWQPKRNASAALVRAWKCSGKRGGHHNNNAPGEDRKDGEHSTEVRRNLRAGESGGRDNLRRGTTVASSFPAKAIVAERGGRYRVAWAPDPRTGKEYADTWEPKHYVSRDLVDAFRRQKRERTRQKQQRQLKREQKAEEKQPSRTAPNEPKTPYAPLDAGRRERELIPENGPTPDVVVGRSALGNAAASRVNEMPRRARRAKVNANVVLSTDENFSPFWDPTCRSRSGRVIQYGAKKNWSLVLRS